MATLPPGISHTIDRAKYKWTTCLDTWLGNVIGHREVPRMTFIVRATLMSSYSRSRVKNAIGI